MNTQLCSGFGKYHTEKNGLSYEKITLNEIFEMVTTPTSLAKSDARWCIPSNLLTRDALKQRENGSYDAVWCDIDDHTEIEPIKGVLANLGGKYAIYSTTSSKPNFKKWRVIIPLANPATAAQWQKISSIINDRLEAAGIKPDRANERVNQLCYLPNKGDFYDSYIEDKTPPLDWGKVFKTEIEEKQKQEIEENKRIEASRKQSQQKAQQLIEGGYTSPIRAYNKAYPLEQCLEYHGYKKIGNKWLSPNSQSGKAGVTIKNNRWISSHTSDANIGRQNKNNNSGDAFDLFCYYEHNKDHRQATKAAGDMFTTDSGLTITQSNQKAYRNQQQNEGEDFSQSGGGYNPKIWQAELLDVVEELNKSHAFVLLGDQARIMTTTKNKDGRDEFSYLTTDNFTKTYMNRRIKVGARKNGEAIIKSQGVAWLEHPQRKQFIEGVVFEPSTYENGIEKPATIYGNKINLWRGYSVKPQQGDWRLIDKHIREVVCSGDEESIEYLYNWIARCLKYPAKTGQVAVALKGEKGCGKGTLCNFINSIFGQHGLQITNAKHLTGNFNAHLADCCFVFADEAFFAGDRQHESVQKTLITEPTLLIERKGIDAIPFTNRLKIMMATNNDWIVPATKDERRYFVLDVSSAKIGDSEYFRALHAEISNTNTQAAFLFDMLNRDISEFNVSKIPETKALQHQREQSLDSFCKYWVEVLYRGYIYETQHGNQQLSDWMPDATVRLIKNGYDQYCNKNKIDQYRIVSEKKMGNYLTLWYGEKKRKRNVSGFICNETNKGDLDTTTGQTYLYTIGTRIQATNSFCNAEKLDIKNILGDEFEDAEAI